MTNVEDSDYFYERAEAELKLAEGAQHPAVVKAHYLLAGYYLDRVYGPGEAQPETPTHLAAEGVVGSGLRQAHG